MGIPAHLRQRRFQTGQQHETLEVASASIETQP
jgi:hypothetical protein